MNPDNPYQLPTKSDSATGVPVKTLSLSHFRGAIVTVIGSAFAGGGIGMAIGAMLGAFLPNYYRSVFTNGDSPNFDPVAVGIGQGMTQGVALGTCVGLGLVAIFSWHRVKSQQAQSAKDVG